MKTHLQEVIKFYGDNMSNSNILKNKDLMLGFV